MLRFIEDNWGLRVLTHRDRQATPMMSAFDFAQPPAAAAPAAGAETAKARSSPRSEGGTAGSRAHAPV